MLLLSKAAALRQQIQQVLRLAFARKAKYLLQSHRSTTTGFMKANPEPDEQRNGFDRWTEIMYKKKTFKVEKLQVCKRNEKEIKITEHVSVRFSCYGFSRLNHSCIDWPWPKQSHKCAVNTGGGDILTWGWLVFLLRFG